MDSELNPFEFRRRGAAGAEYELALEAFGGGVLEMAGMPVVTGRDDELSASGAVPAHGEIVLRDGSRLKLHRDAAAERGWTIRDLGADEDF